MKKALTFLTLLFLLTATISLSAQTLIWGGPTDPNSTFDGGLNDWTTVGISSANTDSSANAIWVWTEDGTMSEGAFWTEPAIASPSVANGAAGFNSDFLDNGGDGAVLGDGSAPAPHRGELISPIMDCSGENDVFLKFHQFYRNFTSTTSIEVSGDGGMTYDTVIVINEDVPVNDAIANDDFQLIDISAIAANNPNVRIKFVFEGDYYFWLIDDVELITRPDHNLILGDFFYPASAFAQPASQIATDSFGFSCDVINQSGMMSNNVTITVQVLNNSGNELYSDQVILPQLAPTVDTFIAFDNLYAPELTNGDYFIRYTLSADETDFKPNDNRNNAESGRFRVTSSLFAMDDDATISTRAGSDYIFGNVYRMSPTSLETYQAVSSRFLVSGGAEPLEGKTVNFYILKVADDIDPGFGNFETDTNDPINADGSLLPEGFNTFTFPTGAGNFEFYDVDILDLDAEPGVLLEAGARYFIVYEYLDDANVIFHGVDERRDFFFISTVLYDYGDETWFLGGFGTSSSAVARMTIELVSSVDESPLEENAFKVFPNPTTNFVQAQVDFQQPTQATITLANSEGRVIDMQDHPALMNETLQFNTSNLTAGTYILRIATKEGTKTHRFQVVR